MAKKIILAVTLIVAVIIGVRLSQQSSLYRSLLQSPGISPEEAATYVKECSATTRKIPSSVLGIGVAQINDPLDADALAETGIRWVRAEFYWSNIERGDGTYNWKEADDFVRRMHDRNIRIAATLTYIPPWLSEWDTVRNHFGKFASAAAERYRPEGIFARQEGWVGYGVSFWEIFNEPNYPGFGWLKHDAQPEAHVIDYAALLAIGNHAIHTEDPQAVIILGGLSPEGYSYAQYLTDIYRATGKSCFDVLAFHPYGRAGRFEETAAELRSIAQSHGDTGKPIWFNEYGTNRSGDLQQLIEQAQSEYAAADGLFWYSLRDVKPRSFTFGLITFDHHKKPGFDFFKKFVSEYATEEISAQDQ